MKRAHYFLILFSLLAAARPRVGADHATVHGAGDGFTASIPNLGAPYVFVRGNHDSLSTQQSVASRKGAYVVDNGKSVTVKGVRIAGIGDPQFTPDRTVIAVGDRRSLRATLREIDLFDRDDRNWLKRRRCVVRHSIFQTKCS